MLLKPVFGRLIKDVLFLLSNAGHEQKGPLQIQHIFFGRLDEKN
jgi:hypothetical protein